MSAGGGLPGGLVVGDLAVEEPVVARPRPSECRHAQRAGAHLFGAWPRRATTLRRRILRRAYLHLSHALRGRSRDDDARARAGGETWRRRCRSRFLSAGRKPVARWMVAVYASGIAGRWLAPGRARVASGRQIPRPQHLRTPPQLPAGPDGEYLVSSRFGRRGRAGYESRRRARDLRHQVG